MASVAGGLLDLLDPFWTHLICHLDVRDRGVMLDRYAGQSPVKSSSGQLCSSFPTKPRQLRNGDRVLTSTHGGRATGHDQCRASRSSEGLVAR